MTNYEEAQAAGYEYGQTVGSWAIDGNTTKQTARAIVHGYDDGDPQVMDMQPDTWTAGDVTRQSVLDELGIDESEEQAPYMLDCYEIGFTDGYWHSIITSANAILEEESV